LHRPREKVRLKFFTTAIAAVADVLVALGLSGQAAIVGEKGTLQIDMGFRWQVLKGFGVEAVIAGEGQLLSIASDGKVTNRTYSDRIGRLFDVAVASDRSYILCGSIGPPMRLLNAPVPASETASLEQLRMIASRFPPGLLIPLFNRDPWRTYLVVLKRQFGDLRPSDAVGDLVPYLPQLDAEAVGHVVHFLVSQGKGDCLDAQFLATERARAAFLRHPEDLRTLTADQLRALIPTPDRAGGEASGALRLLRPAGHSVVVPSLRFKDGRLCIFSCRHILNAAEMAAAVAEIQKICEANRYGDTGKAISDAYGEGHIPQQCPKCLIHHIATYFQDH
jgi:hypothetical protein